jgi:hypothetical protein
VHHCHLWHAPLVPFWEHSDGHVILSRRLQHREQTDISSRSQPLYLCN